MKEFDLIVVGGGAAGFYGAIQAGEARGGSRILILEKSGKLLSKVRVSGGGRCNVTHHCFDPLKLSRHYPRGGKTLLHVFRKYDAAKTIAWFESKGVSLKAEKDGRMFPTTDDSQTIIDCFLDQAHRLGIDIRTGEGVEEISAVKEGLEVTTSPGNTYRCAKVLIATGGSPKREGYAFIAGLGHTINPPIPSLFTFNDPERKFADLMGVAVPHAEVKISATKFTSRGPVLITHWGLSGPAVIRLSAWAAEYLHKVNYSFTVLVSWIGPANEESLRQELLGYKAERPRQKISGNPLYGLPARLWTRLCELSAIPEEKVWGEIAHKSLNRLLENLIRCPFRISGKTTFKEEFVTCGGVDLSEVNLETMESKLVKGVFFAGEVLNIDGETGGFNFQAAWSTGFLAGTSSL